MRSRLPIFLSLCLGLGCGAVKAQDLKPEQRLEAIRSALLDAAMKSHVRVSSTSWTDSRGALMELNRFSSEIKLRELQIDQYKKTAGVDSAELSARSLKSAAPLGCDAPQARSPIRHVMRVSLDVASTIAPAHQYLAQKIGFAARQQVLKESTQTRHWRLMTDSAYKRSYERMVFGQGEEAVQWSLQLSILPARINLSSKEDPAFVLVWQAKAGPNKPVWFGAQNLLFVSTIPSGYGTPKLELDILSTIETTVANMVKELDKQLACDPQTFAVEKSEDGLLVLQAGRTSGLRVGDQIVLADSRVLPRRGIEPGALDAVVLAEVKSVTDYQSEIRPVAGKKQNYQGDWVAWPFIY